MTNITFTKSEIEVIDTLTRDTGIMVKVLIIALMITMVYIIYEYMKEFVWVGGKKHENNNKDRTNNR